MEKDIDFSNWDEKKKRLQRDYPDLTDKDLSYVKGKETELFGRIERRLGISRTETRNLLRDI